MNSIYDIARRWTHVSQFDWPTLDMVLCAFSGTPAFFPTDVTLAQVVSHGVVYVNGSLDLTGQSVSADGTCQSGPAVIPLVPVGPDVTHFVLFKKLAPANTSQPILFIDDAEGLPFAPNGLDMVVQPDWLQGRGWFR